MEPEAGTRSRRNGRNGREQRQGAVLLVTRTGITHALYPLQQFSESVFTGIVHDSSKICTMPGESSSPRDHIASAARPHDSPGNMPTAVFVRLNPETVPLTTEYL